MALVGGPERRAALRGRAMRRFKAAASFTLEHEVDTMETPSWALVPPACFQPVTAQGKTSKVALPESDQQKLFVSVVDETVHSLTVSLLDPKVANLLTQMSYSTSRSFRTSVRMSATAATGLNLDDLSNSASRKMRESLSNLLGRNVRVYVDFVTECKPKGKGKGMIHIATARVVW